MPRTGHDTVPAKMETNCIQCNSNKARLTCGVCQSYVCKSCVRFANEDDLAYLDTKPEYFSHGVFCPSCFEREIEPIVANYNEILARAEQVNIFYKTQSKESRFIRRIEKPIRVKNCVDRDETVMKLAFIAATQGFNIIVDVETISEKVQINKYQTSNWNGSGIPSHIDEEKLKRRFIGAPN